MLALAPELLCILEWMCETANNTNDGGGEWPFARAIERWLRHWRRSLVRHRQVAGNKSDWCI